MTSNITLGEGGAMRNCLVVRLDDSDYVITCNGMFGSTVEGVVTYAFAPSLWQWTKLWWKSLRPLRRKQFASVKAAFFVPQR